MFYCPKCKVTIRGKKRCCPLCEGKLLSGDDLKRTGIDSAIYESDDFTTEDNEAFPVLNERKITGSMFIKICTFITAIVVVICLALRYLFGDMMSWTGAVILGAVVVWLDIIAIMKYRYNFLKVITIEVIVAIVVDYYIDKKTGFHGWSVIWMIPLCLVGHSIVSFVTSKILKLHFVEYIPYIAVDAVLAFAQIYFIRNGENTLPYCAVFVIAAFAITMIAAIIFRFRELRYATEKMFNV